MLLDERLRQGHRDALTFNPAPKFRSHLFLLFSALFLKNVHTGKSNKEVL